MNLQRKKIQTLDWEEVWVLLTLEVLLMVLDEEIKVSMYPQVVLVEKQNMKRKDQMYQWISRMSKFLGNIFLLNTATN